MTIEEEDIPQPPGNGLLVKVKFAGICHSDCMLKHDCEDPPWNARLPFVQGHEIAGVVHTLGETAQQNGSFKVGDRVVVFCWAGCIQPDCKYCQTDNTLCQKRFTPVDHLYGCGADGGFEEYVVVHDTSLVLPLPDNIPFDFGSLLGCSGLTTYNAVTSVQGAIERVAKHEENASLLVVGAGGLGLWTVSIAKAILPSNTRVVVADINEKKLEIAKEHGADATVLWSRDDDPQEQIKRTREACGGGANASVDLVNMRPTVATTFGSMNPRGEMALVGLYKGELPPLPLFAIPLHAITIRGIITGNIKQLRELIDLAAKGKLKPPPIQHVTLADVDDIITALDEGKVEGRAIVKFD